MDECVKNDLVEQWYRDYSEFLFGVAKVLANPSVARDIVQDTFRAVIEMDDLDKVRYPKTWLRKVQTNIIRNWKRSNVRYVSFPLDEDGNPIEDTESCEDAVNIELEYEGAVSKEDMRLLRLAMAERFTYAEIASELGISPEACRKRADRAKRELRRKLEEDES